MKEIRIWGREGFFRKIRCDYCKMKYNSIEMYNIYGNSGFANLIGYANLENINVIEIEDIKDEK